MNLTFLLYSMGSCMNLTFLGREIALLLLFAQRLEVAKHKNVPAL